MPKKYNARGERMYENPVKRENAKKTEKINKNKMKNTETSTSECVKAEVLYRRIMWRLNLLAGQIHESKKKFTCFYTLVQKKSAGEKNENDISWVEAFDDFAENWEEMENVKDEADWMIRDIFLRLSGKRMNARKKHEKNIY